ncbi:MAG: hypothetical protein COU63_01135 [Candidatus Pacebacteria bacterium CG10_big_fil_rev_8_21_14_0_10_36_11]|nr:hypothetical protein [Candidatus Pacearchaeota archaeon]OIP73807.1 MAG: hypothetical protein AUK08_04585 [Candidatus Pacebacteria bacterium CG2_30_36_39]PIR64607.1 MAG: hypothetical protein COU63_01135 [Candidatus Pacebacteria bacterium CG10_big_fil_rev_8_21_14_0_10_36_11]PJC42383.1 MAG: hypothetical protein CO040_04725 [Candidatus Pacebacteria bacterium CG_4_9_14_0_2_um_filter_36_8]
MANNPIKDQIGKLKQRKEILIILLFLFVIVIFWIGLGLFTSQQKLGITPEQKKMSAPLTPNIDIDTLDKIEQKRKFSDYELQDFPIYVMYQNAGKLERIDMRKGIPLDGQPTPAPRADVSPTEDATASVDNF